MSKNNYGQGYQDACQEILDKWLSEGAQEALEYLQANLIGMQVIQVCSICGTPVERNGRDELLHADRMKHAHNHAAAL